MASDTIDDGRTEYGPFASSLEAEIVARRAGFPFLLKYDVQLGEQDEVQDARLVIIELPGVARRNDLLYTRCATAGNPAATPRSARPNCGATSTSLSTCGTACASSCAPNAKA